MIKNVSATTTNEAKERKGEFIGMLLETLGTTLLENMLADKKVIRTGKGASRTTQD